MPPPPRATSQMMPMTRTHSDDPTLSKGDVLSLALQLVAAIYAPPRGAFLQELADGTLQAAIDQVAASLERTAPQLPARDVDAIRSAHVDLFVSSANAPTTPPYVGYAQDGELLGPSAEAVGRFLVERGIGTDSGWTDLPDHVAAVAESAAILAASGDETSARHIARTWLLPWFDRYAAEVASKDSTGLYGPMTEFLHPTIREVSRGDRS